MTQAVSKQLGLFQKQKITRQAEVNSQPYYTQTYGAAYLGDTLELITIPSPNAEEDLGIKTRGLL